MRVGIAQRLALAAAALVLVLASVYLATGGSSSKKTSALASPSATPVVTVAPVATAQPTPAPTTRSVATAAPQRPAAPASGGSSGTAKPPIAGKYVYNVTDSSGTHTANVVVSDRSPGHQTEYNDDSDTTDEVAWGSSGKFDQATTFNFGQTSVRCDWNPDFPEYVFPLHAGASWTERSSCHPSSTSTFSVDGTAHVSGPEHLTVGGESVQTWIVTFDGTLRVQGGAQSFTETIHDEDHFSPEHGVTVKEVTNTTDTDPSGKQTHDSETRNLQNLSPGTSA